jgi:conjugal transfer pilus assembly protein TraV
MEEGKCVPIKEAYNESLKGYTLKLEETKDTKNLAKEYDPVQESYRTALFDKLTKLLRDPKTPILAPPKIVRVMILPYQDSQGKEFYSTRYIYLVVEDPQWILQNINTLPSEESEQ